MSGYLFTAEAKRSSTRTRGIKRQKEEEGKITCAGENKPSKEVKYTIKRQKEARIQRKKKERLPVQVKTSQALDQEAAAQPICPNPLSK